MSRDRRRSPRMEILDRIHGLITSLDVAVAVRDISLGGLSMETKFPFPEGAIHEFRLTMGDGSTVDLRGRVVRCQPFPADGDSRVFVSGVQFIDDEPDGALGIVEKLK